MKLLCIGTGYWPAFRYGGPIYSVHSLNKALVKKGIDVTVYASSICLNKKILVNQEVDVDGVKVIYFGCTKFSESIGRTNWQFSWLTTKALKDNLKNFELVHINAVWDYPVTAAAYYCRQFKKPYIISPRGHLYPYATRKKFLKKWIYYHSIAKRDLDGAAAIHYTTQDEAENCHYFLGLKNRLFVIPNGIDLSEFRHLPNREDLKERIPVLEGKKVILFLSRIHQKKGMDILVKAYSIIAKERNDVHLLIVGDDDTSYGQKVKKWIKKYRIEDKVTFTGMLTGKDKLEAYVGSDMFVLPSYSENFGIAVIEAMACGLPVIISDKVGIYKQVDENQAGVVVQCKPQALYEGLVKLLDNPDLAQKMGRHGVKLVENEFSIDAVADNMIREYKKILG